MPPLPVTFDQLVAQIDSATPESRPFDRLRDAYGCAGELTALADRLLGHYLAHAQGAGDQLSPADEARAEAQQRVQRLLAATTINRLDEVLDSAQMSAQSCRDSWTDTGHLLVAVMETESAVVSAALEAVGLSAQQVCFAVGAARGASVDSRPAQGLPGAFPVLDVVSARATHLALDLARSTASTPGPEHLFLALLDSKEGLAREAFHTLGLTTRQARARLVTALRTARGTG